VGYDPFVSPDYAKRMGIDLVSLEELLAQADFVTLHTPLTDGTRYMISGPQIALLKPGARLINVARGELVDEQAILDGLESGQLGGVALDVFAQEPPQNTIWLVTRRLW
jgi:D-3-phosphoglycerate dehydrogenase